MMYNLCFRVEQRSQRATTPSGSHRVLLKLKKMSSNRPKSMHEANNQAASTEAGTASEANSTTIPVKKKSQLPTSKSMHGFYNRTWNERSLSKYANEHNYENVYNNQHHPNYENVYFGGGGGSGGGHGGCYEANAESCEGCVISQLTCSPRSARARLTQYVISIHSLDFVPHSGPEHNQSNDAQYCVSELYLI